MPKFLEEKLKAEYGERSAIPYKVMNAKGYMRGSRETAKGAALERKHESDLKKGKKVADHTKHGHPPHEKKGHHQIAKPGKQVSGGPGKIKDGHNSAMHDQRVTHDGLHAAGHTKRHSFHGYRHPNHHEKMSGG